MRSPLGPGDFPQHFPNGIPADKARDLRRICDAALKFEPMAPQVGQSRSFAYLLFEKDPQFDVKATYGALIGAFLGSSMQADAIRRFGAEYCFLLDFCAFRKQGLTATEEVLDLHFDGGFVGDDAQAVNYWVSLDDAGPGSSAPGIRFVVSDATNERAWADFLSKRTAGETWELDEADRLEIADEMEVWPVKAGDCLAFDNAILHATQDLAGCTNERISIEFRICAADAVPSRCARNGAYLGQIKTINGRPEFAISRAGS